MESLKRKLELNAHLDDIYQYIDEKFNEIKLLVQGIDTKNQILSIKVEDIQIVISTINDKITEDLVDRFNSLGTYEDFVSGFYEALKGA